MDTSKSFNNASKLENPKIAQFIDTNVPGGAEVLMIEICKNLPLYNFQPEVWHFGNPWLEEMCNKHNIPTVIVPGYKLFKSIKTIPLFTIDFKRLLKKRNISVLHSHLFGPITGACLATFLSRTPHIGTLHDIYTFEEKKSRIFLIHIASLLGVKLVTVSQCMQDYLRTLTKFSKNAIETIFNGVDLNKFYLSPNNQIRANLQIEANDIVFINVARLVKIKRHDILIKAFTRLKSNKHVKLLIVGDGPCKNEIQNMIIQEKMSDNIKLLGFRKDIPELLKISDCFLLSSSTEGLSYSIIEAMTSGLPIIATDVGGNRELVLDGENGYLITPDDPVAFLERIQLLIDDKIRRKEFGKKSLRLAQEKFSLEAMLNKYIKIYRELN